MQNKMQIFENKEFGQVRVVEKNGQPWWVMTDLCRILGLTTPSRVAERLDEDEVSQTHIIDRMGRKQEAIIITESELYAVIVRSDKANAKAFRKWITSEILPSIRKHGAYITDDTLEKIQEDSAFADELTEKLAAERAKKNSLMEYVEKLTPKARY